jgi:hypothetical protein
MSTRFKRPTRAVAIACVALATAVPAGAALQGQSTGAAASSTYSDPAGDANGAPDITEVAVSNDTAGTITMRIAVPDRPQLGVDDGMALWINADRNEFTGSFGDEYLLTKYAFGASFSRWDGSAWQSFAPASLVVRWEPSQLVVAVNRADLGIADAFDFGAGSILFAGDDPDAWPWDGAPDFGYWTYTIVLPPTLGPAKVQPARPKAGRLVSAAVPVTAGGTPVDAGTVKCTGAVGGKRLRAAASGLNGGTAGCAWRLPAGTAGKTLRGQVSVTTDGGSATRTFAVKVR